MVTGGLEPHNLTEPSLDEVNSIHLTGSGQGMIIINYE